MAYGGGVLDTALRIASRVVQDVVEFLTTPRGVFETVDKIIVDVRSELRQFRPRILR